MLKTIFPKLSFVSTESGSAESLGSEGGLPTLASIASLTKVVRPLMGADMKP